MPYLVRAPHGYQRSRDTIVATYSEEAGSTVGRQAHRTEVSMVRETMVCDGTKYVLRIPAQAWIMLADARQTLSSFSCFD